MSQSSDHSDHSISHPPNFKAAPPVPVSTLSMISDRSIGHPPNFKAAPPVPVSALSMSSGRSMDHPPAFKAAPPVPVSTLSMSSDRSIGHPPNFKAVPPVPVSTLSMSSDRSIGHPPNFKAAPPDCSRRKRRRDARLQDEDFHRTNKERLLHTTPGEGLLKAPLCPAEGLKNHKQRLISRCESVTEGTEVSGERSLLNNIFTELFITEGLPKEASVQHEERSLETQAKKKNVQEKVIRCHDIFKPLPPEQQQGALQQEQQGSLQQEQQGALQQEQQGALQQEQQGALQQQKSIRSVLTLGVAGVGKTFSVLKFCLDWAQGSENQDLQSVVPLSFRELNLVREETFSLMELIQVFYPQLDPQMFSSLSKVLLVLDGLDEFRLNLDFSCEVVSDVTQRSEVGVLLVNLIRGDLLPDGLIWLTSRPAAANQIPARCVHRVTEVRGFVTEEQKETYFSKKFLEEEELQKVLEHLRSSRSLHNVSQIPVFCWITATVLEHVLRSEQSGPQGGPLPQTLTDLYAHFLLVQILRKRKYKAGAEEDTSALTEEELELILKLGRLAFEHLLKGK